MTSTYGVNVNPRCTNCAENDHDHCVGLIPTGRQIPDRDPHRDRTRLVAEHIACGCTCNRHTEVPF